MKKGKNTTPEEAIEDALQELQELYPGVQPTVKIDKEGSTVDFYRGKLKLPISVMQWGDGSWGWLSTAKRPFTSGDWEDALVKLCELLTGKPTRIFVREDNFIYLKPRGLKLICVAKLLGKLSAWHDDQKRGPIETPPWMTKEEFARNLPPWERSKVVGGKRKPKK